MLPFLQSTLIANIVAITREEARFRRRLKPAKDWPPGNSPSIRARPKVPTSGRTPEEIKSIKYAMCAGLAGRFATVRTRAENAGNIGSRRLGDSAKFGEQVGSGGLHGVFLKDI